MLEIKLFENKNLKGYTLIDGFPGAGLVGPMAASYIIEKLNMEYIGYIDSDLFPPITAIHDGVPMFTARIYADPKNKLLVVLSEFTIPTNAVHALGEELLSFVRKNGVSKMVSIGGMPSQQLSNVAYVIASQKDLSEKAIKQGFKPIDEGVIAGVSAVLLTGAAEFNIPMLYILVEVNPEIMDPKYAEIAISALNKLLGISIDLSELDKEAKEVEAKVRELLKKAKETHDHYSKAAEATAEPPTYV
ncbi:MAG: proteasome assembly chaperone family protein [Candidatus Micrarchaeia archaeon]